MPLSVYNHLDLAQRRRYLRANQTESEKALWRKISRRQLNNWRFCRQYSVGPYVIDFYCPKLRLAIEVDGGIHRGKKDYDTERTQFLRDLNIRELRFTNKEITENIEQVLGKIKSFPISPLA